MATATVAAVAIRQFQLDVPERDLDELRRRIWATRGHIRHLIRNPADVPDRQLWGVARGVLK